MARNSIKVKGYNGGNVRVLVTFKSSVPTMSGNKPKATMQLTLMMTQMERMRMWRIPSGLLRIQNNIKENGDVITVIRKDTLLHTDIRSMEEAGSSIPTENGVVQEDSNRDQSNLSDIKKLSGDFVTFGGGAKGKITGKGILRVDELPSLKDVLLVDGLTVN
ncbi:hypothetical protein LIER_31485 [Lithospermum erythrorhizon]|uniref:Uncharacterized protein n=1 Tax=Lithospermum erythrorhizon TaxID=34254 RepID=A0AAV3RUX2_LITER